MQVTSWITNNEQNVLRSFLLAVKGGEVGGEWAANSHPSSNKKSLRMRERMKAHRTAHARSCIMHLLTVLRAVHAVGLH